MSRPCEARLGRSPRVLLASSGKKQIEEVEADLGRAPPPLAGGEISGAAGKLDEIANISPEAAIVEWFAQIEASLRAALENAEIEVPPRSWSVYELSRLAFENNLISAGTKEAIDGLRVLRNLAAHGQAEDISPQRAHEFVALAQAVLFAISLDTRDSGRRAP